jgi:hypothetical protein
MPSKTAKQARTMAAAAHNPKFAKKVGIPTKVAKEFNKPLKNRFLSQRNKIIKIMFKWKNLKWK